MAKEVFVEGNTLRVVEVDDDEEYEDTGNHDADDYCIRDDMKEECIDGVVYAMSMAHFRHGTVVVNLTGIIRNALRGKPCRVFAENLEYHYRFDVDDERRERYFLQPDVMICCDESCLIKGGYYAAPKFVAEVLSPSTANRDKKKKFDIYEETGVSEYWIVHPSGLLDIYYLIDGHYKLQVSWELDDDKTNDSYNANEVIALRDFPDIKMTLGEIFE